MLNQPMSSPQMIKMFGFLGAAIRFPLPKRVIGMKSKRYADFGGGVYSAKVQRELFAQPLLLGTIETSINE